VDNARFSKVPRRGRCAACNAAFDPDLEQGGNTNVVVRRDPTGDAPVSFFTRNIAKP
jgi:hypothetical protein